MRTLYASFYASLPPSEGNAFSMLALENDDELMPPPRKTPFLLDLSIIRAQGYAPLTEEAEILPAGSGDQMPTRARSGVVP
jgi:hypothetical protein